MAKRPKSMSIEIPLFHIFVLPSLWLVDIVLLAVAYWDTEGELAPFFVGWVGGWLALIGGSTGSYILALVFNCIGGVLMMALIGFFQDVLRVPKWVCVFYLVGAVVVAVYLSGVAHIFGRTILVSFGINIYVVSFLTCAIALGWRIGRKWFDPHNRTCVGDRVSKK